MLARKFLYLISTLVVISLTISGAAPSNAIAYNTGAIVYINQSFQIALPIIFNNYSPPSDWWRPPPKTTWQWQLSDQPIDMSFDVDMYDIDMFENNASVVTNLHGRNHKVICYISAGSWEN